MKGVELAAKIVKIGNENALSDAGVAAITAKAAAKGAYYNIKINMPGIEDEGFQKDIMVSADKLVKDIGVIAGEVEKAVEEILSRD